MMENTTNNLENANETSSTQTESFGRLYLNIVDENFLTTTAKWGKFLGIIGFIFTGIIVLLSLFMGTLFSQLPNMPSEASSFFGPGVSIFYILTSLLYFFPALYLFKFSSKIQEAIANKDQTALTESLKNQKSLFLFMGITTCITLGLYAFFVIVALIFAAAF